VTNVGRMDDATAFDAKDGTEEYIISGVITNRRIVGKNLGFFDVRQITRQNDGQREDQKDMNENFTIRSDVQCRVELCLTSHQVCDCQKFI